MLRWDNWLLWFVLWVVVGCALILIGLVVMFGGGTATEERETSGEQPTASPQTEEPRATPTPMPRPTPTSTPTPKGLGVSFSDFEEAFDGLTFDYTPLNDGRGRWMATSEGIVVDVVGSRRSVEQATLALPAGNAIAMSGFIVRFFEVAAPGWDTGLEWVGNNFEEALWTDVHTTVGDRVVSMSVPEQHGLLWITVTPR
jgi:hypothetical protein